MRILFLYLTAFSRMGGLEKFNRAFCKALAENPNIKLNVKSLYDQLPDARYIKSANYKGFGQSKIRFIWSSLWAAFSQDIIFVGHINLAPVANLIKRFFPKKKIVLITHGIEVWYDLPAEKLKCLQQADFILSVSHFTKSQIVEKHKINAAKILVFPNTIDPYFPILSDFSRPAELLKRHNLPTDAKILLTVGRLSASEQYKGYDKVIETLAQGFDKNTYFMIIGKADEAEKQRVESLITKYRLEKQVILVGFVSDQELLQYYLLADLFVMPSKGEGFGIVFLEAMVCGLLCVGGNKDGSVDALANGSLGRLVNPENVLEIRQNIQDLLSKQILPEGRKHLQQAVIEKFGFEAYQKRLAEIVSKISQS